MSDQAPQTVGAFGVTTPHTTGGGATSIKRHYVVTSFTMKVTVSIPWILESHYEQTTGREV
jgi:hypothetical protein